MCIRDRAWSGDDPVGRPWKGKVYGSERFNYENRKVLFSILKYCKKKKIPTIFWNKEDPIHYEDKVHNFVDTAIRFDHIFTSASECVKRYKEDYGHKSVHELMFATQPMMFNPIEEFERTEEIVFAGSWYAQHPERCSEMEKILDGIIASGLQLKIYDRHSGTTDPNHFFPEKYRQYVHPKLEYEALNLAYKGSKYALNFNTSTQSKTMFARRVFELMSSNTCVLSNYSEGMKELFAENVFFVDEGIKIINAEAAREANLNLVLSEHTYEKRFHQILTDIHFEFDFKPPLLNVIKVVDSEADLSEAIETLNRIVHLNKKNIIMLSQNIPNTRIKDIFQKYNSNEVQIVALDYVRKYEPEMKIKGKFVIVDGNCPEELISKAFLHICYLDKLSGIMLGKHEYKFEGLPGYVNTVFDESMFVEILDAVLSGNDTLEFKKYLV